MRHSIIPVACIVFLTGCAQERSTVSSGSPASPSKNKDEIQTIILQYRIAMDAVAPSRFVAVYPNGMTLGLKIRWKIGTEEKKELDRLLARLEKDELNGKEFTAKAKWVHEGFDLEVYEIQKKF